MVAPTDAPAAAPAGKAAGPPYGLPPLPAIPCPDFRGPTPWSNWVIKGRLLAGGRWVALGPKAGDRRQAGGHGQAAPTRRTPPAPTPHCTGAYPASLDDNETDRILRCAAACRLWRSWVLL